MEDEIERAIDALYVGPLERFVDERKAVAKRARALDKALAARVLELAKPTPAAWAVNRLAARGALEALFRAGAALRVEQGRALGGEGDAGALARATAAQRAAVASLVAEARVELGGAGLASTDATLAKVRATLETLALWGSLTPPAGASDESPHGPRLARELEAPSLDSLAALLGVTTRREAPLAPVAQAASEPGPPAPNARDAASTEPSVMRDDEARQRAEREAAARARATRRGELARALESAEVEARARREGRDEQRRALAREASAAEQHEAEVTRLAAALEVARALAREALERSRSLEAALEAEAEGAALAEGALERARAALAAHDAEGE